MTSEQLPFYIGRYKVTGELGSGGMGVVYLATDERLNRRVAVKRLARNPTSSNAHLRIRKEALLLAQLNHSNIVQIYDVVEEREDVALVMEYVNGSSLGHWQRERNPSLQQKIQLLKQIGSGLARAHSIGIIHRDLKADNILIDETNTAKITDFGIAKNWRENSDLTREQHVAGSWGAMSPEQALGKPLDNRCDLFALGVLAYRLLCGQDPFGDHESPFIIVDRIVNSQHPPAAKLNPELPPALCQLLDKLLAKNPDKRPLNATAVVAELDAILQELDFKSAETYSRTVTVTAESFHRSQRRRGRLRRILVGGTLASAAALLVAAAAALLPEQRQPREGKYIAIVAPAENALADRESELLASSVMSALKQGLSSRDGLFLVPYSESEQLRGQPLREQARALNAQLLLHPSISCEKRNCEASLELIDTGTFSVIASRSTVLEQSENLESRARILQQLNYMLPDNSPQDPELRFNISAADYQRYLELYEQRSDFAHLGQTIDALEDLLEKNPGSPLYYEFFSELIKYQQYVTRNPDLLERLERVLARAPQAIADHPALLTTEFVLAMVQTNGGERARAALSQAKLKMPDQARYYQLKAIYHHQRSEYGQALEAIDKALALRTSAAYLRQKADTLSSNGDMEAAKTVLLQALALNPNDSNATSILAAIELDTGHPGEAIRLLGNIGLDKLGALDTYNLCLAHYIKRQFERAQTCFSRVVENAPADADPLLYQAEIARAQKQPLKARQLAERALALTEGREDWEGILMRARAYAELGEGDRAVDALMEIRRVAPDNLYVNYARAQIYITSGDLNSAKAHIRKTLELGMSPIWLTTEAFASVCSGTAFSDLRGDHPDLCTEKDKSSQIARK